MTPRKPHIDPERLRRTSARDRIMSSDPVRVVRQPAGASAAHVDLNRIHALAETGQRKTPHGAFAPEQRKPWYRVENRADVDGGGAAEVYLFDMIGGWGVSAADFARDLRAVTASEIDLHVSCEGGAVFDALAMYETLRRHPANITAHIDGIAASSASFVVQAANKIIMAPRARMMIHNAHGLCGGDEYDMEEMRDLLRDASENIADIYALHAGGTREQWRTAMRVASGGPNGTWYDARAAVAAGLADEVSGETVRALNVAGVDSRAPEMLATWSPGALSAMADTIENPLPAPVAIPDGAVLRGMFDLT
jgi:ATP-dependent protease ClpP protease subunit